MMHRIVYLFPFLFVFACGESHTDDVIHPRYQTIVESVYASAKVIPDSLYSCRPSSAGIIDEIYVDEGDTVIIGQPLFRIRSTEAASVRVKNALLNLQEAENNYRGENSVLSSLKLQISALEDQHELDSINFARLQRLWDQEIGSKEDLDRATLAYQTSKSQLQVLKNEYDQKELNLRNQILRAQNQLDAERDQLQDFIVNSQINGVVYSINKEVGEFISSQEAFGELGSDRRFHVEMDIDEVDIAKIELGDTAVIQLEAFPDRVYLSKLTYISNKKDPSTQTFSTESKFIERPPKLFNGLSGEANIIVDRQANALVIPAAYLMKGDRVMTEEGELEVKTGMKSLEQVEIISGIDTSATLILPGQQ